MALPRRAIRCELAVIKLPSGYVDGPGPSLVRMALVWLVGWRCYTRDVGTADEVEAQSVRASSLHPPDATRQLPPKRGGDVLHVM